MVQREKSIASGGSWLTDKLTTEFLKYRASSDHSEQLRGNKHWIDFIYRQTNHDHISIGAKAHTLNHLNVES